MSLRTPPSARWFSEQIGALGVGNDSRVVVYDRRENMWAARLWWYMGDNAIAS